MVHSRTCWIKHHECARVKIQQSIKRNRKIKRLMDRILVVMHDGDPKRQAECSICQDVRTLLEELDNAGPRIDDNGNSGIKA